jgi:hypothetical protein
MGAAPVKAYYSSPGNPLAEFTASDLMRDAEYTIHVRLRFDWRFRLGMRLVRLGFRLMGAKFKVADEEPLP